MFLIIGLSLVALGSVAFISDQLQKAPAAWEDHSGFHSGAIGGAATIAQANADLRIAGILRRRRPAFTVNFAHPLTPQTR